MATPTELQTAYSGATLSALERELVRRVIGISGVAGDPVRDDSETRLLALDAPRNVSVREVLDAAGEIGFDRMKIAGGSRAAYINPMDTLVAAKNELLRIIYGDVSGIGFDPRNNTGGDDGSGISFVRLGYRSGSQSFE